ncbi:MAG: hypothetical protein H6607_06080 [Flavobacteriales bacterium]|nr:hypothetical protein [Flavobacteriales bacterium]
MTSTETLNYRFKNEHPYYFGAYLNMARNNLYLTLAHIADLNNVSHPNGDTEWRRPPLIQKLNQNEQPDTVSKIIEKIDTHLPFVQSFIRSELRYEQKQSNNNAQRLPLPSDYYKIITEIVDVINDLRNFYVHSNHQPIQVKLKTIKWLEHHFDVSIREVAERYQIKDDKLETGLSFLRRRKGKDENPDFKYSFKDRDDNITEKGLAYLICLFLEKSYAFRFLSRIKGFKRSEGFFRYTKEVFSSGAIRIPKPRLKSDFSENALFLDVLNELGRCPRMLYAHLSETDKKEFQVLDEQVENPDDDSISKLVRGTDRFNHFAMRLIDENNLFEKLRFQIDLGTYYFKEGYEKNINGENRIRHLNKRI